jgi:hypothetical protein
MPFKISLLFLIAYWSLGVFVIFELSLHMLYRCFQIAQAIEKRASE